MGSLTQKLISISILLLKKITKNLIMKSFAYACLAASVQAGFEQIKESVKSSPDSKIGLKNVGTILGDESMAAISGYGCWCHFDEDHGKGKGAPVDSVDAICKNLQAAYDCAMMDYAEATGNDDCIPWEVSYQSGMAFGIGALVDNCNAINSDLCSQYACMAEGAFVINIIGAFLNIGSVDPNNLPQNGFDFRASCPVNSGSQTDERQCCGVLPYRYPYKPVDRECCGAATYDPSLMECCSDNIPKFSCV